MDRPRASTFILVITTLFYSYGAVVHVMNILGMTGFEWSSAPLKWQVLDVIYLGLDVIVCVGLFRRFRPSIYAFYFAASTQIILYTALRSWITNVPEPFSVSPDQDTYLSALVVFHLVSTAAVSYALLKEKAGAHHGTADF